MALAALIISVVALAVAVGGTLKNARDARAGLGGLLIAVRRLNGLPPVPAPGEDPFGGLLKR